MSETLLTPDLATVIAQRSIPGLTYWNRLEGRPRQDNLDRVLRAEVRDAMWMLARQWQVGELTGDDAASPVTAKVRVDTGPIVTYQAAGGDAVAVAGAEPLEARVEALPVPLIQDGLAIALDLRLMLGRYWLKLVTPLAAAARAQFIATYPVRRPDPAVDALICADPAAWASYEAAAGRLMDGAAFYAHLKSGGAVGDGIAALAGQDAAAATLGERFIAWYERLITQPVTAGAWQPSRLDYAFAATAPDTAIVATGYNGDAIDWYAVDVDPTVTAPGGATGQTQSMIPTGVTYRGMPDPRWWAFEDGGTNFGMISPDATDLAKLLLIEFALVYSNDWFVVPVTVPTGTLADVRGVAVTDVFGDRTWVGPATSPSWSMFTLATAGQDAVPGSHVLARFASATRTLDGPALDDVTLARDESANMVWAVETGVPSAADLPVAGALAGRRTREFLASKLVAAAPMPAAAPIRYELMSSVPEQWIPFVPVHKPDDVRAVQLQRAAMPRVLDGDAQPPAPVRPRTWLMRTGLEQNAPYYVHEEEVPRAGTRVTRRFRRTRASDGRAWVWLGARTVTGRGETSSGLAFDLLVDVPYPAGTD